jgi:hypothetical protein
MYRAGWVGPTPAAYIRGRVGGGPCHLGLKCLDDPVRCEVEDRSAQLQYPPGQNAGSWCSAMPFEKLGSWCRGLQRYTAAAPAPGALVLMKPAGTAARRLLPPPRRRGCGQPSGREVRGGYPLEVRCDVKGELRVPVPISATVVSGSRTPWGGARRCPRSWMGSPPLRLHDVRRGGWARSGPPRAEAWPRVRGRPANLHRAVGGGSSG